MTTTTTKVRNTYSLVRNYYKMGYKGKPLPSNVANDSLASYEYASGRHAYLNDGKLVKDIFAT